jgi:hypothetical protein
VHKLFGLGSVLALLIGLAGALDAQDAKPPTIKEIMGKLNKGPNSLCPSIGKDLRADEPKWDDIQKEAKEFATFAEELPKRNPPRGDKANWEKLAKAYAENAKGLDAAAQKKDKPAAQAVHRRLADMKNCNACHDAHRP